MKEAKLLIIIFTILLFIFLPLSIYYHFKIKIIYDILMGINTGLFVSLITSICQYIVAKRKIINDTFNCYFQLYKTIYTSERQKILFHYSVISIYKELVHFSSELSRNLSNYSGFIPNNRNNVYKTLNRNFSFNKEVFNFNNIIKLAHPNNKKRFEAIVIPLKKHIESILNDLNQKKFHKDLVDFIRINEKLGIEI